MQNNDFRAKQFLPFWALEGFSDALKMVNNNEKRKLKSGDFVKVKYYYNFDYIETSGKIKKIDLKNKCIYLLNSKINFDDIIKIE